MIIIRRTHVMLGAIIDNLAAWTYEHDRTRFWSHLVSKEVKVSEFGLSVIVTAAMKTKLMQQWIITTILTSMNEYEMQDIRSKQLALIRNV